MPWLRENEESCILPAWGWGESAKQKMAFLVCEVSAGLIDLFFV